MKCWLMNSTEMLESDIKLAMLLFKAVENWRFLFAEATPLILSHKHLAGLEYTNKLLEL